MFKNTQPWIGKPWIDILFVLSPPFLCLLIIACFPQWFANSTEMSEAGWVILVLLIDVAHVYSTLYRTYFDPQALSSQRSLLWTIPFVSFVAGVLLYSFDSSLFWRVLAYVAVFHFIRQQYGLMRLYSRKESKGSFGAKMDTLMVYTATIYPLLYWHFKGDRNFNWFIDGDFIVFPSAFIIKAATVLYVLIIGAYFVKEMYQWIQTRSINIPKLGIITGTLLSWYFGIVYFNGDMAFTLLNVVSHGIPYMALIWYYGEKKYNRQGKGSRFLKTVFSNAGLLLFLAIIFLLAFIEEGLWDLAVWKEHAKVFRISERFQLALDSKVLSFVVPLLAVPQLTHYILDGFIWKIREDEIKWSSEVGGQHVKQVQQASTTEV